MKGIHIGEVLVEQGAITKEQLNEGLKQLKAETNDSFHGRKLFNRGDGGSSGFICAGGYPSGDQYENPADSGGTDADPPRD